tara:strand:+ start:35359 stop:36024 length:666 start_codon:yes stop_codon:yes gene_type:complete
MDQKILGGQSMNISLKASTSKRPSLATAGAILFFAASSNGAVASTVMVSPTNSNQNFPFDNIKKLYDAPKSGDQSVKLQDKPTSSATDANSFLPVSSKLDVIISGLGLNISDLEKVIGVKRATLYNWKKGGDIKDANSISRLEKIFSIAQKVAQFNSIPLTKRAKNTTIKGKSYLDLLQEKDLDDSLIVSHAKSLAAINKKGIANEKIQSLELSDIQNITG